METIIELPDNIKGVGEVKGYLFDKIYSDNISYIYKVTDTESKSIHYEVIKRTHTAVCLDWDNKIYSDSLFREVYPKSTRFGDLGFTFKDLGSAKDKVKKLIKENKKH